MNSIAEHEYVPAEHEIQHVAYNLWNQNGRPEGRDAEFWYSAIEMLKHSHAPVPTTSVRSSSLDSGVRSPVPTTRLVRKKAMAGK